MLIDWFTVGAQALNFLILVWLLKHFLYKPILNAIATREKRIAKELADADAKKAEAQKEHDEFQHKNEEFDRQRAALLTKATEEAKAERQRLLDEARKAADAASAKRQESLRRDAHNLNQAVSRLTQQEVFAIARKTLSDLATTSLEESLGRPSPAACARWTATRKQVSAKRLRKRLNPRFYGARLTYLRNSALRYKMRSMKPSRLKSTSASRQHLTWSAGLSLARMERKWLGASRITSHRWKRASTTF